MSEITEKTIERCALILGQFNSERVNLLVMLFHHQDACVQLTSLSNDVKREFENLLTTKNDDDEIYNDTPLTRIELAIMIDFKEKYFSALANDNDNKQPESNIQLSIDTELNAAYCFLIAQIDDLLSKKHVDHLKFLLNIPKSAESLFNIYQKLGETFPQFFSLILQCEYLAKELVKADKIIRYFQSFIKRYEDFLIVFLRNYKPSPDNTNNYTPVGISNGDETDAKSSFITNLSSSTSEKTKSSIPVCTEQSPKISVSPPTIQPWLLSSPNIPQKALCVIINIKVFTASQSFETPKRAGSDKDVDVIRVVFNKFKFTVLECKLDFTKDDLDKALDHINDESVFGNFDCLVMFIMSHGLLHSFFTADSKAVIVRDIVKRYSDSSPSTIWTGKSRLFFIQACRSSWPEHHQRNDREELKQSDLSPRMLVAYSCSASQASKRSPTQGSIFIQMLCIMLLHYGHLYRMQTILDWTKKFVITRDEYCIECIKKPISIQQPKSIQQPEFIERDFSSNFRFSNSCLYEKYRSWSTDKQIVLSASLRIWEELYDIISSKIKSNH